MARPLLPPSFDPLSRGRPLRVPPLFLSSPSQQASSPLLSLSLYRLFVSLAVLPCFSVYFFETVAKNISQKGEGRAGQGKAVRGRGWARSATDVFLIRFLICGQSNCNWFVIVSRLRCETSGDFFCIVCPDRGIPSLFSPLLCPPCSLG